MRQNSCFSRSGPTGVRIGMNFQTGIVRLQCERSDSMNRVTLRCADRTSPSEMLPPLCVILFDISKKLLDGFGIRWKSRRGNRIVKRKLACAEIGHVWTLRNDGSLSHICNEEINQIDTYFAFVFSGGNFHFEAITLWVCGVSVLVH